MEAYKKDLEVQTSAMRVCTRMLLGTHVQHGKYLKQVDAIKQFGDLGIVRHTVEVMHFFSDSPQMMKHSLWLLSLLTQSVENAREAGRQGANEAITSALKSFAVFGKASPAGQKWGCACVVNMAKSEDNRKRLVKSGVLQVVGKLLDNSKSVMCDAKCIASCLGAITELARKPNFEARKVLVDLKVQVTVNETIIRVEERKRELFAEKADDEKDDSEYYEEKGDEDEEAEFRKFTHEEVELLLEASKVCMEELSCGIPEAAWKQSLTSRKFQIDWDLMAKHYKIDAFESGGKTAFSAIGRQWLRKSEEKKLENMRKQYSSLST